MDKRAGPVVRLATPLKAWAQRFAFLLLITAAFAVMLVGKADTLLVERLRVHVTDAVAPILDVSSRPVESFNQAVDNARELAELREINAVLRQDNDRLMAWHHRARRLEAENAALRAQLNVMPDYDKRFVTARVIADVGGAFVRSVLVNAGFLDGVAKGQAALSGEALVGRIAEVGERAGRVLLITDINSRIPVLVGPAGDRAVLAGDNTEAPALLHMARGTSIEPGDLVVTSGHGGVFPKGLPVGVVSAVGEHAVRVRPYADWAHLEYLRLVDYELPGIISRMARGADQPAAN